MGSALTDTVRPRVPPQTAKHDSRHGLFHIRVTSRDEKTERQTDAEREDESEREGTEAEMRSAELAGSTVAMIRDDWRLRYDHPIPPTPTTLERERGTH